MDLLKTSEDGSGRTAGKIWMCFFPIQRSGWANRGCQLFKGAAARSFGHLRACTFPTLSWIREPKLWKIFVEPHGKRYFWHLCEENDRFPIWLDAGNSEGSGFVTKRTDWKERGVRGSTRSMVGHAQWEQEEKLGFVCSHPLTETNTWSADWDKGQRGHCRPGPWSAAGLSVALWGVAWRRACQTLPEEEHAGEALAAGPWLH